MFKKFVLKYHSISSKKYPGVVGAFPITLDRFIKQINFLKKLGFKFDFISNIFKKVNQNTIYITSDDGTSDWAKNVLPYCEENNIPTHTAIISGVYEKQPIYPLTHIIQIILAIRDKSLLKKLANNLEKNFLSKKDIEFILKLYHYESSYERKIIKGAFNLVLEPSISLELIGELSNEEKDLLKERFIDINYLKQFKFAEVGNHTRRHLALDINTKKYIESEINPCKEFIIKNNLNYSNVLVSPMKPKQGASLSDLEIYLKDEYIAILDSQYFKWDQKSFIIPRIDAIKIEEFFKI